MLKRGVEQTGSGNWGDERDDDDEVDEVWIELNWIKLNRIEKTSALCEGIPKEKKIKNQKSKIHQCIYLPYLSKWLVINYSRRRSSYDTIRWIDWLIPLQKDKRLNWKKKEKLTEFWVKCSKRAKTFNTNVSINQSISYMIWSPSKSDWLIDIIELNL